MVVSEKNRIKQMGEIFLAFPAFPLSSSVLTGGGSMLSSRRSAPGFKFCSPLLALLAGTEL